MEDTSSSLVTYWPVELLRRRALRRGPVLRGRLGATRYVYLLGPEANALVFGHDEWFSVHEAMKGLIPVDGPTSVVVSDGADHARRRGLVRPALAPRSVARYLEAMDLSAREAADAFRPGVEVDAYPVFRSAIRRSTLRALFGSDVATRADELGATLQPMLDLIDRLPQAVDVHRRLHTPTWRRAMAARDRLDAYVHGRIAAAREDADAADGVLGLLVHGRDGTGSGLSEQEVRDQAVTLIAAGYETTSAAMGWIVHALAHHRRWQERAREEARAVAAGTPTPKELTALTVLPAIVDEALRLYPPAAISARHVEQPFTFAGEQVRAGEMVVYSAYVTHRDPRVFERPTTFDPGRWIDAPRPGPESFVPFGGGAHRCPGSHMATTELTIMLAHLLAAGPFVPVGRRPRARSFAAMRPTHATVRLLD